MHLKHRMLVSTARCKLQIRAEHSMRMSVNAFRFKKNPLAEGIFQNYHRCNDFEYFIELTQNRIRTSPVRHFVIFYGQEANFYRVVISWAESKFLQGGAR